MVTEAIILAGGLGTRLKNIVNHVPKSMASIGGKPFLEYQLNYLIKNGIQRVILSVGYKKEIIIDYFGNKYQSMKIIYSEECEPLGTGGAIKLALREIIGKIVYVINGDTYFDIDLKKFHEFHEKYKSFTTIAIKRIANTKEYGNVSLDSNMRIQRFEEKKSIGNYINGGVYIFKKGTFENLCLPEKFSIERDYFMKYFQSKKMYGYVTDDYFIDIGTPKNYRYAENQLLKRLDYKEI